VRATGDPGAVRRLICRRKKGYRRCHTIPTCFTSRETERARNTRAVRRASNSALGASPCPVEGAVELSKVYDGSRELHRAETKVKKVISV